jgi:hypothetical protein
MAQPREKRRRNPPRKLPGWMEKVWSAKHAALATLSDEEKVEAEADRLAMRERARARRAASLALAQRIFGLHDAGHNAGEIAAIVGRRSISVVQFAASRGVYVSRSTLVIHRAVQLTKPREDALRRMAADYGKAAHEALDDLLTFLLDDDAAVARRILRVGRQIPNANTNQSAA